VRIASTMGNPITRAAVSLGVAVVWIAAACLVGCSRVGPQPGASAGNPWTRPGVLRWGEYTEPDTLNPLLSSLQVTVEESMLWAGYLFEYDDRNEFVPELATRMPTLENGGISADGLRITYHLRPGVRWQDGAPFGADDVIFTWHAVMNPRNDVPGRSGYDLITAIDKLDDHTIVVHLSRPYAPFTATFFTMAAFAYPVLPVHLLGRMSDINRATFNSMPIGTGPFRVVDYRHGQFLKLVANASYWRGPPRLKEIYISFVGDQNTLLTQLRTHEIDLVTNVSLSRVPDLGQIDGITVHGIPFTYFIYVGFNTQAGALSDVRVRRALALATDKRTIVADVTHGYALPADSDQPPFSWAYSPPVEKETFDPRAAGALLDAAGWRIGPDGYRHRGGARLDLVVASTAGATSYRSVEELLQQQWRRVGVQLTIKDAPDSVLYAPAADGGVFARGSFDVMVQGWFNGVDPDDSEMLTCGQRAPVGDNYTRLCDPRLDSAELRALATYRLADRKKDYAEIQRLVTEDRPMLFLWFAKRVDVANTDLRGYRPAHAVTTLWNTWEWSI
jgi:peptide/nickel transport system substrate-binding protein